MKIAFLSKYSPNDRKASSGTNYKMAEQLSKIGELKWIKIQYSYVGAKISGIIRFLNKRLPNKICLQGTFLWNVCQIPILESSFDDCDVIVAFFCMPTLAHIKTDKPIIYFSDATFPAMVDYYPEFTNLFKYNVKSGIGLEKKAMDRATKIVLSSDWAAKSAVEELDQPKEKVEIIELGANIDEKDIVTSERKYVSHLDILFLGVDWVRKGGGIAVEAIKWLNENGIEATLHIVGIRNLPEEYSDLDYVINYGFLNKNIKEEYRKLVELLRKAHCLLLPTKAECAGIAFAEASANGLPVFTHDTGGVSNYIKNGENGYRLPLGSTGIDFGMKIKETIENGELQSMVERARDIYNNKLNWNVWGRKVKDIMDSIV